MFKELLGCERKPVVRITSPKSLADSVSVKSTVVAPETLTVFDAVAKPTKETVIVADPLDNDKEYIPSVLVDVPRLPAITEAPAIPLPDLSLTLPVTEFCAEIKAEGIIVIINTINHLLIMDRIKFVLVKNTK